MSTKRDTIIIPTGYETDYRKAESRRTLAEKLQAKAMGDQGPMQNWLQPLSQIGQAWIAKSMVNDADKELQGIDNRLREDYYKQSSEFDADAKVLKPEDLMAKWGTNPLMADRLDPYKEAMKAALKEREETLNIGGRLVRKGDVGPTGILPNDPNAGVIYGPDGEWVVNPVRATAAQSAQGLSMTNPTYSMQDPRGQMAPGGVAAPAIPTPPTGMTKDGRPAWLVNGQWYDNPEGN